MRQYFLVVTGANFLENARLNLGENLQDKLVGIGRGEFVIALDNHSLDMLALRIICNIFNCFQI